MVNAKDLINLAAEMRSRREQIDLILFEALLEVELVRAIIHQKESFKISIEEMHKSSYPALREFLKKLNYKIKAIDVKLDKGETSWEITW